MASSGFFVSLGKDRKNMDAYTSFARVYDMFMDNIPYEEWCEYLTGLLREYGVSEGLVLDLGCGTGTLTELMAQDGYDMIGVDCAEDMLEIAMEKKRTSGLDILYLLQDMREFELYGTVKAVVSICDSVNYLLEYEDLVETFRLVNNYLDPEGVFIFDLNTEYKYQVLLADRTIAENREEGSFIWDNYYDEESRINEYDLALFIPEQTRTAASEAADCAENEEAEEAEAASQGGLFRKYQETHFQRAFSLEEVRRALAEAGLEFVACYDAFTREAPREDSERVYFIAREHGKKSRENQNEMEADR
ncbi:MAG: class I SAM-dependent methyltransferase [Lachnospiraceae bacterium]|nr:class I SAM-dependent methyltransferase [Lachnospiraceae bacterium]